MKFLCLRILIIVLACFGTSCDYFKPKQTKEVVARVGDEYLYKSDLNKLTSENISRSDSIGLVKNFIDSWAVKKLFVEKAQTVLSEKKLEELESLVDEYRTDIYANAYKEVLISTSVDTVVSINELKEFYNENKDNFMLNEELLKLRYVSVDRNFEGLSDLKENLNIFEEDNKRFLQDISYQFKSYSLNDSTWVRASEVIKKLPVVEADNIEQYLKKAQIFELTDSLGVYLVFLKDILSRNSIAPLEYVKLTVKQIIINKRRLDYNRRLEKRLLDEAYQKKHYEIY